MGDKAGGKEMISYKILVLANAVPGREAEFNDWYTHRHIADILGTAGFKSAQRFVLAAAQVRPDPGPHRYAAIYEVETDDIQAALDRLAARRKAGQIAGSDSIAADAIAYVLEPVTGKISATEAGDPPSVV